MKKQFWIMVKQFLLYLLLDQGVVLVLMIPLFIYAIAKGYGKEAMEEHLTSSYGTLCIMVLCYIVTIAVFLKKRYVRLRPGRIDHSKRWKTIVFAMLIAWGWMFVEIALLQLSGIDKLFPKEEEDFEMIGKLLENPLGLIAGGILGPITEEIAFRGVVMGGLLRMRCKPWVAIILSGLVFAVFHGTYTQLIGSTIFGIICGWLYWRTKSLWPSIIVHIVNNSTACILAMCLPDPEADLSTLTCLLLLVFFVPMLMIGIRWFKQRRYSIITKS